MGSRVAPLVIALLAVILLAQPVFAGAGAPERVGQCVFSPVLERSAASIPSEPCTGVQFWESDGWHLVMPFRGNFGGTPYLDDGWIMNVWTDRQGNAWLYIFVHESDPRYPLVSEAIWGTWGWLLGVGAGRDLGQDSGPFYHPGNP